VDFGEDRGERLDALLRPRAVRGQEGVIQAEVRQLSQAGERFAEPLGWVVAEVEAGADRLLDLVVVPSGRRATPP